MRLLSIPVLIVLCGAAQPGQPTAKELIAKYRTAIGADGPKLSSPYVIRFRGQRYQYELVDGKLKGEAFDFDASLSGHSDTPQRHRNETEMKIGVVPFRMIEVVDEASGWYQINDSDAVALSKGLLDARRQREIHVLIFLGQESFDAKHWQFSEPKSTRVRGQDVWQFEARSSGLEPITLAFAKDSGLLVHLKTKANDFDVLPGSSPKVETFTRDFYFSNWRKFGNRMMPGHFDAFRDGILWKQMEAVGVSFPKTMDAKLFVMPKPAQP